MNKVLINFLCAALLVVPALSIASTTKVDSSSPTVMQSTKQVISDSEITSKVKSHLFFNKNFSGSSISVSTVQGRVTLTGNVSTKLQMHEALKIAYSVSGVKSVKNDLIINHDKK